MVRLKLRLQQLCHEVVIGYAHFALGHRAEHGIAAESLPFLHNDPFDRIMIAQARVENMRFMSHDKLVTQYGEIVLPV